MSSRDYIRHLVANTTPGTTNLGDEVFDPVSNRLYKTIAVDGTGVSSIEVPVYVPNRPIKFPQSANNYLQIDGSNTGNTVIVSTQGVDSNVSMSFVPKNAGAFNIQAGGNVNISNGSGVTSITRTNFGTGYTGIPSITISPPTTAGGVQATASAFMAISNYVLTGGGTGYNVGDVLSVVGGTYTSALQFTVATVSSGVIQTVTTGPSFGIYSALPTNPVSVTGGTGSGATFTLQIWGLYSVNINNPGSGYVEQPTVTFSGGGGNSAAAFATIGSNLNSLPKITSLSRYLDVYAAGGQAARFDSGFYTNAPLTDFVSIIPSTFGGPTLLGTNYSSTGVVNLRLSSQSTGAIDFFTNSTGQRHLQVSHTASAVNYVQVTGSTTGNPPIISSQGSDGSLGMKVQWKGTGNFFLQSGSGSYTQFRVSGINNAVNNFAVTGNTTGNGPILSSEGSDTNVDLNIITKGTGNINLQTANGIQFRVADNGGGLNAVNYVQVQGSNTGNTLIVSAQGTDANVAMTFLPKGNGAFNISTANGVNISSGNTSITNITRTSLSATYTSAPTVIISPPTTAGGVTATATVSGMIQSGVSPTINAGGTGYSVSDVLTVVGGTPISAAATLTVTAVSGGVITGVNYTNYSTYSALPTNAYTVTGGTGTGAQFSSTWYPSAYNITNIGSGYVEQPTISYSGGGGTGAAAYATVGSIPKIQSLGSGLLFYTPSGQQLQIQDSASVTTTDWIQVVGSNFGRPVIRSNGTGNPSLGLSSSGTGAVQIYTNATAQEQLRVAHTASAVNYVTVTGSTTGSGPTISVQGSDSNVALNFSSKAAQNINFRTGASSLAQFTVVHNGATIVNQATATGSATGVAPSFGVQGTDANIDVSLVTKGTGGINFQTGVSTTTQFKVTDTSSAVNYLQVSGSITTQVPIIQPQGSDTNVGVELRTKNAGTLTFTKFRDATTPNQYLFQYAGGLNSDGSGGAYWRGLHIGAPNYTVSAANKFPRTSQFFELQSLTDPTYVNSYYALSNSNGANIEQYFANDTGGGYTFKTQAANSSDKSFRIAPYSTHVNYLQVAGANTANAAILSSQGSDTNVSLAIQTKGTGAIDLAAGSSGVNISNGNTVTAITGTATGSGYTTIPTITISPPTTAGGTQATGTVGMQALTATIVSGGTGYTANDVLTVVGGTGTAAQITVSTVSSGVITAITVSLGGTYTVLPTNPISVTGGTGSSATFNLTSYGVRTTAYTITGAGSGYVEQPTVTFSSGSATAYATVGSIPKIQTLGNAMSFYTPSGEAFRVSDIGVTSAAYWQAFGGAAVPELRASSSGIITATGANSLQFRTNTNTEQFRVAATASAVNYVQVTGAATSGNPVISPQGSDTNISLLLSAKGTGGMTFNTQGSTTYGTNTQFAIFNLLNSANFIAAQGAAAGAGPTFSTQGSDTNIDISLVPKGAGRVTTSATLVAGLISGGTF